MRTKEDSGIPCDLLLLRGSCIVNEAMLSGESTPLLKESVEVRPGSDKLDIDGVDRNSILFGGTKVLQATGIDPKDGAAAPDGGCLAVVLRTGFGTSQGQLIRTMIFSTETVTANNIESFLFIGFLLVFALAASAYVWVKGLEQDRKRSKLLLDCVIIITSVVPPELPMELSMAVNASLVALSKYCAFTSYPPLFPCAGRSMLTSTPLSRARSHLLHRAVPDPVRRPRRHLLLRQDGHHHGRGPRRRGRRRRRVRPPSFSLLDGGSLQGLT